jgi:membrane fusion protein (multidrug efflux system)
VEIIVSNASGKLKPGFFAKGAILTEKDDNVLAIPQEALSMLAGVSSVYVIENGQVRQQNVKLGVQEGNFYEVVEGLQGTESLAASSLNEITTGMKVTVNGGGPQSAAEGIPPAETPAGQGKQGDQRGPRSGVRGDGANE